MTVFCAATLRTFFSLFTREQELNQRGPTAGPRANLRLRIIIVITIGLPCVPKIPDMSGNDVRKFAQM